MMNHLGSLSQAQARLAGLSKDQRLCVIPWSAITRMHFEELSGRDSDNLPPGKCAATEKEKDPAAPFRCYMAPLFQLHRGVKVRCG